MEKSESAPGTRVTEAYSDTRGVRRRIQCRKEQRGSQHSSGYGAHMGGGRTAGICQRTGGAKGGVRSVTRESHYETWRRCTRRVEVGVYTPAGRCYDTLAPGSGPTTRRAAVLAGVHMSGVERQHNGVNAGQTSLGGAMPATGRPTKVRRRCRRVHGWQALWWRGQCRPGMSPSGGSVGHRVQSCHTQLTHIGEPGQEAFGYDLTPGKRVGTSE